MTKHQLYFIFDGVGPVDGEFYTYEKLIEILNFHTVGNTQPDYQVFVFDPKAGAAKDITEAMAHDWWEANGEAETYNSVLGGSDVCWLADRFFNRQVGAMEERIYARANAADRWHDEMAVAQ